MTGAASAGAAGAPGATGWDVDALLDDRGTEVVVCCGSGGVGKTTAAAALALRAAERGRRVAVLTVDPARRLAQALGTDGAGGADGSADDVPADEPRRVAGVDTAAGGSLDALVLDAARTLDGLVDAALPPQRAAAVKANPVYTALATSFSGTQEYMAMERLGQLRSAGGGAGGWDLVVVDTPPSRSALDFLEAPSRLAVFLDGRFARLLTAPARLAAGGQGGSGRRSVGGRVVGALAGGAAAAMDRVIGGRLLRDVQSLVAGLDEVFGGFRARAEATTAALSDGRTAFVVVTAPEQEPLTEAAYLVERLRGSGLRPAAVVVNRATRAVPGLDAGRAQQLAEALRGAGDAASRAAAGVLDLQVELLDRVERERELVGVHLAGALVSGATGSGADGDADGDADGGATSAAVAVVPALDGDVADLQGLRAVGAALAAG